MLVYLSFAYPCLFHVVPDIPILFRGSQASMMRRKVNFSDVTDGCIRSRKNLENAEEDAESLLALFAVVCRDMNINIKVSALTISAGCVFVNFQRLLSSQTSLVIFRRLRTDAEGEGINHAVAK